MPKASLLASQKKSGAGVSAMLPMPPRFQLQHRSEAGASCKFSLLLSGLPEALAVFPTSLLLQA